MCAGLWTIRAVRFAPPVVLAHPRVPLCRAFRFFLCFFEYKLKGSSLLCLCGCALCSIAPAMCVCFWSANIPCMLNVLYPLFAECGVSLGAALPSDFSHPSSQLLCVEWPALDFVCVCFQCNDHLSFRPPSTCSPFDLQLHALHCMWSPQVLYMSSSAIALPLLSKWTGCVLESHLLPLAITLAYTRQAYDTCHPVHGIWTYCGLGGQ